MRGAVPDPVPLGALAAFFGKALLASAGLLAAAIVLLSAGARLGDRLSLPSAAQPPLPMRDVAFVSAATGRMSVFRMEVAATPRQQAAGLMFRWSIPDRGGMLFPISGLPRRMSMWMRNCPVAEDMAFVGRDGRIQAIAHAHPDDDSMISGPGASAAVVEARAGAFEAARVAVGDLVLSPALASVTSPRPDRPSAQGEPFR